MNKWQQLAAIAALFVIQPPLSIARAAETDTVVLRLKDTGFEFSGKLRSFDGLRYIVAAPSFGVLSLDATRFECDGAACTQNAALVATQQNNTFAIEQGFAPGHQSFVIDGASTIGFELMPQLIRDFAHSRGGAAKQVISAAGDAVQFKITDARGTEISMIDLKRRNSSDAFASLLERRAAIGMSSRPISTLEAAAMPPIPGGIHGPEGEVVLALDALAILVAPENPAKSLSIDALAKIFAGKITNWSELGLPAGIINIYAGTPGSGANEGFDDLVMRPRQLAVAAGAKRIAKEFEISDAVARDPRGIGIASLAVLRNAKALAIAGTCGLTTAPSVFAVKSEEYPLGRRLYLYTAGLAPRSVARDLLAFASSAQAQATVQNSQFIDQSIEKVVYTAEKARFVAAIEQSKSQDEKARATALAKELEGAKRLSTTLRFAMGSARLDAKARDDVARLKALLAAPDMAGKTVLYIGYTDSVGTALPNERLSYRRAEQINDAVAAAGFKGTKLSVLGKGPLAPIACNDTAEGQQLNRRVEVWIKD